MKHQTLYLMVQVIVHSAHPSIADTVHEVETQAVFSLSDTPNINVLETEILITRVRNPKNINYGTSN